MAVSSCQACSTRGPLWSSGYEGEIPILSSRGRRQAPVDRRHVQGAVEGRAVGPSSVGKAGVGMQHDAPGLVVAAEGLPWSITEAVPLSSLHRRAYSGAVPE